MNRRSFALILFIAVLVIPALPAAAQGEPDCQADSGTVITREIDSEALGHEQAYSLYLPPDWCSLDDLPLLVMLHGWDGDNTDWVQLGHIDAAADALILAGEIRPLIILMPDGDNGFYVDSSEGNYEAHILELVEAVDAEFPTAAVREERFVGGLSMGGYGALYLGLRHPDLFSAIGAHSPAILALSYAPPWLYGQNGELYAERYVPHLITLDGWPDVRLFLDVGNSDYLIRGVFDVFGVLINIQGLDFQGHVWPGVHDWDYWSEHAPEYLRFYAGIDEEAAS